MKSFSETLFFDCGIDAKHFGENALSLGSTDWWAYTGVLPPKQAISSDGEVRLLAAFLIVIVSGMLSAWGLTKPQGLQLLKASNSTAPADFWEVAYAARRLFFIGTYEFIAYPNHPISPRSWIYRPNTRFQGQTPLHVMLNTDNGIEQVLEHLEQHVLPVLAGIGSPFNDRGTNHDPDN